MKICDVTVINSRLVEGEGSKGKYSFFDVLVQLPTCERLSVTSKVCFVDGSSVSLGVVSGRWNKPFLVLSPLD